MHHSYTLRIGAGLGIGSIGFVGRLLLALGLIFVLKYFDKDNREYSRGIKKLLIGAAVVLALGFLIGGLLFGLLFLQLPFMF